MMISMTSVYMGILFIIVYMMKMVFLQSANDVFRLKKYLFENQTYDSLVRPALNQTSLTEV